MDLPDRIGKLFGGRVFEEVPHHSGVQCAPQISGARKSRDDHDLDGHAAIAQACSEFEARQPRHLDVGYDDIGAQTLRLAPGVGAVGTGGEDLHVVFQAQQRRQRATKHCLVLG